MELSTEILVHKTKHSRLQETDFSSLEFGKYISDHMLVCDYANGNWGSPQVLPYANLSLSPAALALHYGQTVFEGMKAFRMADGRINIFRIDKHYDRFVKSLQRMCMAVLPKDIFVDGMEQLIRLDHGWVPSDPGTALYIRPFMIASEARLGVKVSEEYRFIILTGPVPALYADPIKIKVELEYVRAAKGGTGFAKCGGNYGASFYPTRKAKEEGYDQVLWTDSTTHEYIEESGMMNIMFVINDILITPPLSDSILDGVTRDSLLAVAKGLGYKTSERQVPVKELQAALSNGTLREAFGAGTAAVVAPVKTICIADRDFQLPEYNQESMAAKIKQQLELVRSGKARDVHGWNFIINGNE